MKVNRPNIIKGDIIEWAKNYKGPKFHALLCDPPYHLQSIVDRFGKDDSAPAQYGRDGAFGRVSKGFMGKEWDGGDIAFDPETWRLLGQHLYPGAFGMAYAASRGWHRLAVAIEDGGFIIHPSMFLWVQSQGFPKATRIDNQVDRALGKEDDRKIVGIKERGSIEDAKARGVGYLSDPANRNNESQFGYGTEKIKEPATEQAKAWEGHRYGLQALKPTVEPIILFQKPYDGRPVENMMETGAGALNIDAGRIGLSSIDSSQLRTINRNKREDDINGQVWGMNKNESDNPQVVSPSGRWPCNFILAHSEGCKIVGESDSEGYTINRFTDGAKPWGNGAGHEYESSEIEGGKQYEWECVEECPVRKLGEQGGYLKSGKVKPEYKRGEHKDVVTYGEVVPGSQLSGFGDSGTASRFFYQSDWSYEIQEQIENANSAYYCAKAGKKERNIGVSEKCSHPTVKPLELNRYLASLLLPPDIYAPDRSILVPFAGVGSEMIGAMLAGWDIVLGIELDSDDEYIQIADQRIDWWYDKYLHGYDNPKEILKTFKPAKIDKDDPQLSLFGDIEDDYQDDP